MPVIGFRSRTYQKGPNRTRFHCQIRSVLLGEQAQNSSCAADSNYQVQNRNNPVKLSSDHSTQIEHNLSQPLRLFSKTWLQNTFFQQKTRKHFVIAVNSAGCQWMKQIWAKQTRRVLVDELLHEYEHKRRTEEKIILQSANVKKKKKDKQPVPVLFLFTQIQKNQLKEKSISAFQHHTHSLGRFQSP